MPGESASRLARDPIHKLALGCDASRCPLGTKSAVRIRPHGLGLDLIWTERWAMRSNGAGRLNSWARQDAQLSFVPRRGLSCGHSWQVVIVRVITADSVNSVVRAEVRLTAKGDHASPGTKTGRSIDDGRREVNRTDSCEPAEQRTPLRIRSPVRRDNWARRCRDVATTTVDPSRSPGT